MISTKAMLSVIGAVVLTAGACGGNSTPLGNSKTEHEGGVSTGGTLDGASGTAGEGGGAQGASDSGASGGSGAGATGGGGSSGGDAGQQTCNIPKLPADPNPTPEKQQRAALIHAFCAALQQHSCLDTFADFAGVSKQARYCTVDDRILACEQDTLYDYVRSVTPECDDEWQTAINCAISADYTASKCKQPLSITQNWHGDPPGPCDADKDALEKCMQGTNPYASVTGSRATCQYGPSNRDPRSCLVQCQVGKNWYHAECSGPPGLPLACDCNLNGVSLPDDGDFMSGYLFAGDCRQAAQFMADGHCVARTDCCFTFFDRETPPAEHCVCTADPTNLFGPSCEAAAQTGGGRVVELCPKYALNPGWCWPPDSC
jgi:hypothetical protein